MSEYVPTDTDIDHYRRVRAAGVRLGSRLTKTVPRDAMHDIGTSLGLIRDGVFVFETEDVTSVLMDCCLHDWVRDGKNLTQRYTEENPPPEDPAEREALEASLRARYTLLLPTRRVPGAGVYASDLASQQELFLMDIGLGSSPLVEGIALATRIKPLGSFWMTGGAALPVDEEAAGELAAIWSSDGADATDAFNDPAHVLKIVRTCLDTGMASHISMATPGAGPRRPMAEGARPSRNAPCPCGSGKQYKRCCGRRGAR